MNWRFNHKKTYTYLFVIAAVALLIPSFFAFFVSVILFSIAMTLVSKKWINIGLVLSSTVLAFAAGEIIFILLNNSKHDSFKNSGFTRYYEDTYEITNELGHSANPGVFVAKLLNESSEPIYDVKYTIGEDGFRITPEQNIVTSEKITFFGCSFTFGEGLNDNQTLPYLFSKNKKNILVKNYAFHGYGVHQALYLLKNKIDPNEKNTHILITAPWHAERSACSIGFTESSPKYEIINGHPVQVGSCDPFESTFFGKRLPTEIYSLFQAGMNRFNREKNIKLYLALIEEMKLISDQRGQKFIVGYINATAPPGIRPFYNNEKIKNYLISKGITLVDLSLDPLDSKYIIHELDPHPTELANQVRAKILFDFLFNSH